MPHEQHAVQLTIPGCCGSLEGRLLYGPETTDEIGAILCPPHPLLAGNMDNNVLQAVAGALAQVMPVLLFNYPGVGKSTSPRPAVPLFEVWNTLDQTRDYGAIVDEVRGVIAWSGNYFRRYHLVGYSFGACMALAARTGDILSYTAIAPPLTEEDFSALPNLACPVCLIFAQEDTLLSSQPSLPSAAHLSQIAIPGADHFFLRKETAVAEQVAAFLHTVAVPFLG